MGLCRFCGLWVRLMWDGCVKDHQNRRGEACEGGRWAPEETKDQG